VLLCRYLIEGTAWTEALQCVAEQVKGPARFALLDTNVRPLDRGGYAPEVLRAAIAFVTASRDFPSALQASMDFAGPSNYSPVLVGAIAGARWGITAQQPDVLQTMPNHRTTGPASKKNDIRQR
jgi:ADP-ribosylglycohydrolase